MDRLDCYLFRLPMKLVNMVKKVNVGRGVGVLQIRIHLLLFITRRYTIICLKRRPIVWRYSH